MDHQYAKVDFGNPERVWANVRGYGVKTISKAGNGKPLTRDCHMHNRLQPLTMPFDNKYMIAWTQDAHEQLSYVSPYAKQ